MSRLMILVFNTFDHTVMVNILELKHILNVPQKIKLQVGCNKIIT